MLVTCLHISFSSNLQYVKACVGTALEYLQHEIPYLTEEDLFDMRLIYSELIANAMVHGNKNDFGKKVDLTIEVDSGTIKSVIKDEGIGFNYSNLSNSIDAESGFLNEHGRGLKLVRSLTDFVEWNDAGNEIMFCKKF